ncbi:MAG: hypothetical protein R3246_13480, partial [Acidimicrobiia bacterium]|nr:hypothetical protein [Acidimicrobiia bacterium]
VPEHRDGFWDDLATRLDTEVQELPLEDETRSIPGWLAAPAAAVVVLVAVIGVSGLLGGSDEAGFERDGPGTADGSPSTTAVTSTTMASPDSTLGPDLPDAPWAVDGPVPVNTVPQQLVDEWSRADNRSWCSAFAITDPTLTDGFTPRAAEFSGGWGLAYDAPDLRSAFGVAGAGLVSKPEMATRWPTVQHFADGSVVGYGGEGFDEANPRRLGELAVAGQGCMYQVWSELGDEHLAAVIESLRFVDGLQAEPVEFVDREVRDGGTAPWSREATGIELPPLVADVRTVDGPLLWPTTIEFDDDTMRTAAVGAWAVAWDVPGQPGHDSFNRPCAECGRGTVGFAEFEPGPDTAVPAGQQLRIRYDDDSFVEIGYYVGDDRLPPDRPQFTTVDTGEPTIGGYQAIIFLPDGRQYLMWSHLGLDHLLSLVEGLREVG